MSDHFATGGPIDNPQPWNVDALPCLLPGEYVLTAAELRRISEEAP